VQAFRPLTVALYSSGDELCPPTTPLGAGQIYDSNRVGLSALLTRLGVQVNDAGILPDRLDAVTDALRQTATQADVILTSGGVSVGEADYLTTAVRALGELAVWKVAMKPGKPFAFGTIGKTLYFGLPGNPVSALVTFQQFVQDALRTRMGMNPIPEPLLLPAIALDALKKEPGRAEFQRGWLSTSTQGLTVRSTGAQDSHLLSSLLQANCYIVLPTEQGNTPAGSVVQVQPLLP
jgi:molybdopterin molybdotransferase